MFDKEKLHARLQHSLEYPVTFVKWLFCAVLTGVLCGSIGTAFHYAVDGATYLRMSYPWLLYLLPVAGLLIVFSYRMAGVERDPGTNLVIRSIRSSERVPLKMAPLIFFSATLTHLCGGSAGREGAALQIGGSVGARLGRALHLREKDLHIITMCGMSALFSALFGTPVTAALFCMEVISVGVVYYVALLPCLAAAITAQYVATFFGVEAIAFSISTVSIFSFSALPRVIVLAIACALVSILFIVCIHRAEWLYHRFLPNSYLRAAVGGLLLIGLTLLVGTRDYNGTGMEIIGRAISGQAFPLAFLLKILFTALTIGAGFKGGEIIPTFFIGSTLGCALGGLLGLDPGFAAALGLVGVFCGVVNCPLASLLLSIELFGSESLPLFALVCAISYLLSGYYSLYAGQKIIYSKLRTEYINQDTH